MKYPPGLMGYQEMKGEADRFNEGKAPLNLVAPSMIFALGSVLDFGAKKYDNNNWAKGMKWSIVIGSLMRHLFKWASPFHSDFDEESGYNHLWHVACNVMFLIEYEVTCPDMDDRLKYDKKEL